MRAMEATYKGWKMTSKQCIKYMGKADCSLPYWMTSFGIKLADIYAYLKTLNMLVPSAFLKVLFNFVKVVPPGC